MWTVKSESGRLHSVLLQDSAEQFWSKKLPFAGVESSTHYISRDPHAQIDGGHEQWMQLPTILKKEGVRVFEVKFLLEKILEDATVAELKDIVEAVWDGMTKMPDPEELTVDMLFWGYPTKPYYDLVKDKVVIPDHRRVSWIYPRDTSFTSQIGTVICKMKRYSRRYEPRVIKLCYEYDPVLSRKMEIIYDANDVEGVFSEPPCIEGGDTQIIDEETIAIGVGQRSTLTGVKEAVKHLLDKDRDEEIKYICVMKLAGYPAVDYMHLDVIINWPNTKTALVMPYVYDTELVKNYPSKRLLLKYLEAVRAQSEAHGRPMWNLIRPDHFADLGRTSVYVNRGGKPELLRNEVSLLDFCIREDKLDPDKIIYVGGVSQKENDVEHMLDTMMEQSRGAPNIFTIKPGTVIAYKRNRKTNNELRNNGITVKEWDDSYLDLLGGPHCSTNPLWRDSA
jgi:arginine deiminase